MSGVDFTVVSLQAILCMLAFHIKETFTFLEHSNTSKPVFRLSKL